jgi:hypothetical protein
MASTGRGAFPFRSAWPKRSGLRSTALLTGGFPTPGVGMSGDPIEDWLLSEESNNVGVVEGASAADSCDAVVVRAGEVVEAAGAADAVDASVASTYESDVAEAASATDTGTTSVIVPPGAYPPIADSFDDNLKGVQWLEPTVLGGPVNFESLGGSVAEVNGRLEITTALNANGANGYASANGFNFTGQRVFCKVTPPASGTGVLRFTVYSTTDGVNGAGHNAYFEISFSRFGTKTIRAIYNRAGSAGTTWQVTHSATDHAWIALRFTATDMFWETAQDLDDAPDGWTIRRQITVDAGTPATYQQFTSARVGVFVSADANNQPAYVWPVENLNWIPGSSYSSDTAETATASDTTEASTLKTGSVEEAAGAAGSSTVDTSVSAAFAFESENGTTAAPSPSPSGSNRAVFGGVVSVNGGGGAPTGLECRYGGSGGTLLSLLGSTATLNFTNGALAAFGIAPGPEGATSIFGDWAGGPLGSAAGAIFLTGVSQATPFSAAQTNGGAVEASTVVATITFTGCAPGQRVVALVGSTHTAVGLTAFTEVAGTTLVRQSNSDFVGIAFLSKVASGSTCTLEVNVNGAAGSFLSWSVIAVAVNAAPAGAQDASNAWAADEVTEIVISENTGADYSGLADTYLHQGSPNLNTSSESDLIFAWDGVNLTRILGIKAAMPGFATGKTVVEAGLRLYKKAGGYTEGSGVTMGVYRALVDMVIAEATWFHRSTGNIWNTTGGRGVGTDRAASLSGALETTAASGSYVEIPLDPALVQGWIDGTFPNYGVLISRIEGQYSLQFSSSEDTDGQRPELRLVLTTPGGSAQSGSVSESATATEDSSGTMQAGAEAVESTTAVDEALGLLVADAVATEAASATETVAGTRTTPGSVTEPASATETTAGAAVAGRGVTEPASAADAPSASLVAVASRAEPAAAAETVSASGVLTANQSEPASATDLVDGSNNNTMQVSEPANAQDSTASTATMNAASTEPAAAVDAASAALTVPVTRAEPAAATDTASAGLSVPASLTETAAAVDAAFAGLAAVAMQAEAAVAVDSSSSIAAVNLAILEIANALDLVVCTAAMIADVIEAADAADASSAMLLVTIQMEEGAAATDVVSASEETIANAAVTEEASAQDTSNRTVSVRAMVLRNGVLSQIETTEVGTNLRPVVLVSGKLAERVATEGVLIAYDRNMGKLRTLASDEDLLL